MDETRFDTLARTLATGATRRRALGAALAVAAPGLAGSVVAKPGGNGKGKAYGRRRVGICQPTGNGGYRFIRVAAPSLKHGHKGAIPCPTDDPCNAYGGPCDEAGACTATPTADGTSCTAEGDLPGTCTAGACVANPTS